MYCSEAKARSTFSPEVHSSATMEWPPTGQWSAKHDSKAHLKNHLRNLHSSTGCEWHHLPYQKFSISNCLPPIPHWYLSRFLKFNLSKVTSLDFLPNPYRSFLLCNSINSSTFYLFTLEGTMGRSSLSLQTTYPTTLQVPASPSSISLRPNLFSHFQLLRLPIFLGFL